jgi:hypothetical protein
MGFGAEIRKTIVRISGFSMLLVARFKAFSMFVQFQSNSDFMPLSTQQIHNFSQSRRNKLFSALSSECDAEGVGVST